MVTSEGGGGGGREISNLFIYGKEGNRESRGSDSRFSAFQRLLSLSLSMVGRASWPSLFLKTACPFNRPRGYFGLHGSIDRSGEGCINNQRPPSGLFGFQRSRRSGEIHPAAHGRAKKACVRRYEAIDFAFTRAGKGP